jgi:hypothetical protein
MCSSLSKKYIIKNHLNRLKQGEGLLKIFAITKLKTYYGNARQCVTGFYKNQFAFFLFQLNKLNFLSILDFELLFFLLSNLA